MSKVAIVSYDVPTIFGKAGGVGAFTARWASLLRKAGEAVTIVMTRSDYEPMRVDVSWRARYQSEGISLVELQAPPAIETRWPEVPAMRISEIAAPVLQGFDIVYFQDWGNPAFHLVRARRFGGSRGPVCVTVLHGPSEWELSSNARYPDLPADAHLAWLERYSARHSDFVVSPSRYMADHLVRLDWRFPGEVEALGLPMPEPASGAADPPSARIREIVCFARIEERKGIRNFSAALRHLAKELSEKPAVVLLGTARDELLLNSLLREIGEAGFAVRHEGSLDSDGALRYLSQKPEEKLCVIPSPADNFPYAVVEASLIRGLNVIACRGGGVPEILPGASRQICDPLPRDLAGRIADILRSPLSASELTRYDCTAANERWMAFHRKALASTNRRVPTARPTRRSSVDVCVTYYQKAPYLSQLIDALEQQTEQDFHVIAVNDGSPDQESNRVFEEQAQRCAARGWDFYRQANAFVDAARNSAAVRGHGDLILFVDSDDVPARNAVARMREAMELSGDDALICASYLFASEKRPCDSATGEVQVPAFATCIPLGMDLVGGLVNPCAFGGSMFIIRRAAFEKIGGFRELRGAGHEDWEFYVRLALAGFRIDALADVLQFYRQVEGSLARTLPAESSVRRLLDPYEEALSAIGLKGGALALAGLYRASREAERRVRELSLQAGAPAGNFAFFRGASKEFETPSGAVERLREVYRKQVSLESRLKFHRIFLAPFFRPLSAPRSMRIALVQSDPRSGQRALRFARALRMRGHHPVFVAPQCELPISTPAGAAQWQAEGFPWIPVGPARLAPAVEHFPRDQWLAAARALAPLVETFDAVWFFERRWAMPALRERRFRERALPLVVLDGEIAPVPMPASFEVINGAGAEQYALRWCDAVLDAAGRSDAPIGALEAMWRERAEGPARQMARPKTSPAVTVCIPYFEAPEFLPATLESLERQTSNDFTVIAVDDGSFSARACEVFDACALRFAGHGWSLCARRTGILARPAIALPARPPASSCFFWMRTILRCRRWWSDFCAPHCSRATIAWWLQTTVFGMIPKRRARSSTIRRAVSSEAWPTTCTEGRAFSCGAMLLRKSADSPRFAASVSKMLRVPRSLRAARFAVGRAAGIHLPLSDAAAGQRFAVDERLCESGAGAPALRRTSARLGPEHAATGGRGGMPAMGECTERDREA